MGLKAAGEGKYRQIWGNIMTKENDAVSTETLTSNAEVIKWFVPLVQALKELGGEASRQDAHDKVIELCHITDEELNAKNAKSNASKILNQIDWARQYLADEGIISREKKGIWKLTEEGQKVQMTDDLAGKIFAKQAKIRAAEKKGKPVPEIDLLHTHSVKEYKEAYTKQDFLKEVYMTSEQFDTLVSLLENKKNLILQGAPGVGKTFTAKRLAYAMMGEKDESRIQFVQFHQSYSYEDFMLGYKPAGDGFELREGAFYRFCDKTRKDKNKQYFFLIDEINRGNLSKIFGELLMLIERDYRDTEVALAYHGKPFSVPENLYIIGIMNTADRSLAMIDYALRRRFSFFEMEPGFGSEGFRDYQKELANQTFNALIQCIQKLNRTIAEDDSLGKGFCIGHSYFCGQVKCTDAWMKEVVSYDIIPMLEEYWFDDPARIKTWKTLLSGVFHDE